MKFMIKTIDLIDVIPNMTVRTDISAFDNCQCHRNSTGNLVTEKGHCESQCRGQEQMNTLNTSTHITLKSWHVGKEEV